MQNKDASAGAEMTRVRERVRFSAAQWVTLAVLLLGVAAFAFGRPGVMEAGWQHMPGIGLAVSACAALGCGAWLSGGTKARWNAESIFLFTCAALISLSYAVFGNDMLRLMNLPVLLAVMALALFSLSGQCEDPLSARGVWESLQRFFCVLFRYVPAPFQAASALRGDKKSALRGLVAGLIIALPVLGVVLALLARADEVFGGMLQGVFQALEDISVGGIVWKACKTAALGLLTFSCLYALSRPARAIKVAEIPKDVPALPFGMVLFALCAAYAVFVYVQFRYLFGGAADAAMQGGYAQYARSGFFELVGVSCISLLAVLPTLSIHPKNNALRALCAAASLLTLVILFSAAWRMRLYIQAYGMTLLRAVTLFGILMLFAALALSLCKAARPGIKICRPLLILALAAWIAFNYVNVDYWIARYNVQAHESGALETLDAAYLAELSPAVLPALNNTPDAQGARDALDARYPGWYDWSLTWLHVR